VRQFKCSSGINTPWERKLGVAKELLKPNHPQNFEYHVDKSLAANFSRRLSKSSYGNGAASKKGGRTDKYAGAWSAIVTLSGNTDKDWLVPDECILIHCCPN